MKKLALFALACLFGSLLPAQTAQYPGAVVSESHLKVARNRVSTTLRSSITAAATSIEVSSATNIVANMLLTIDSEIVSVTSLTGTTLTVVRGFDGTTAVAHSAGKVVSAFWDAWHHNAMAGEVRAIEMALGPSLSNVTAIPGVFPVTSYDFAAQAPGGSLTAATPATVTLTPCPFGVNGADPTHYLYVSGGVGTAEAVLITGGTCTSGAATGTVTFTPANNHTGAWTIQSATDGVQEAVCVLPTAGGDVAMLSNVTLYANVAACGKTAPAVTKSTGVTITGAFTVLGHTMASASNKERYGTPEVLAVQDKGGQVFDVKAYGAKGDGAANDTVSIQAAITAASAVPGGIVYLPPGTYNVTNLLARDAVTITGAGQRRASQLQQTNNTGGIITFRPNGANLVGGGVRNLSFSGPAVQGTEIGILFDCTSTGFDCESQTVDNVTFYGVSTAISSLGQMASTFSKIEAYNMKPTTGVAFELGAGHDRRFSEILTYNGVTLPADTYKAGFHFGGPSSGDWVVGADIMGAASGYLVDPVGSDVIFNGCVDCLFDTAVGGYGINLSPGAAGGASGLVFTQPWVGTCETGIYIGGTGTTNHIQFNGLRAIANKHDAVRIDGTAAIGAGKVVDAITFTGGTIVNNSYDHSGVYSGISVKNATRVNITGMTIGALAGERMKYGIFAEGGSNYLSIVGNNIYGNVTGSVSDTSTGDEKKVIGNAGVGTSVQSEASGVASQYKIITSDQSALHLQDARTNFKGWALFNDGPDASALKLGNFVAGAYSSTAMIWRPDGNPQLLLNAGTANADAGYLKLYANSATGLLACKTSAGADCIPPTTAAAHNILSATHSDSTAASATRGDIITAQGVSPKWVRLAKGTQYQTLAGGANEPTWGAVALDQTTAVSGILGSANGGTGNGFTKFAGPAGAEKTYTGPNANATLLTTNAAVTVPQGGTGLASGTSGGVPYFDSATTIASSAAQGQYKVMIGGGPGAAPATLASAGTAGQVLVSGGAAANPAFSSAVPYCTTYTVLSTNAAFIAAATAVSVTLAALPANAVVTGVRIKHSVQYSDGAGAMTAVTASLGDGTTHTAYSAAQGIGESVAVADTTKTDTSQFGSTTAASSNLVARFTATGANFGTGAATSLLTGTVAISVCAATLP